MIELFIAFGAGLISFLSPCVLPLIPGYISYISGSSLNELLEKKTINIFPIILFAIGFSIVFISFGATASFLGSIILENSYELRIASGIVIIIFSLQDFDFNIALDFILSSIAPLKFPNLNFFSLDLISLIIFPNINSLESFIYLSDPMLMLSE